MNGNVLSKARSTLSSMLRDIKCLLLKRLPKTRGELTHMLASGGLVVYASAVILSICCEIAKIFDETTANAYAMSMATLILIGFVPILTALVLSVTDNRNRNSILECFLSRARSKDQSEDNVLRDLLSRNKKWKPIYRQSLHSIDSIVFEACRSISSLSLGKETPDLQARSSAIRDARKSGAWDDVVDDVSTLMSREDDLVRIWQSSVSGMLDMNVAIEPGGAKKARELSDELGIEPKIDAYYAGVPVEDIIA